MTIFAVFHSFFVHCVLLTYRPIQYRALLTLDRWCHHRSRTSEVYECFYFITIIRTRVIITLLDLVEVLLYKLTYQTLTVCISQSPILSLHVCYTSVCCCRWQPISLYLRSLSNHLKLHMLPTEHCCCCCCSSGCRQLPPSCSVLQ